MLWRESLRGCNVPPVERDGAGGGDATCWGPDSTAPGVTCRPPLPPKMPSSSCASSKAPLPHPLLPPPLSPLPPLLTSNFKPPALLSSTSTFHCPPSLPLTSTPTTCAPHPPLFLSPISTLLFYCLSSKASPALPPPITCPQPPASLTLITPSLGVSLPVSPFVNGFWWVSCYYLPSRVLCVD